MNEPLGSILLGIRMSEMLGILLNTGSNILGITLIFKYFAGQNRSDIECFRIPNYEQQLGMSIAWLVIEFLVFTVFLATMLVCLVKSFIGVDLAADNSKMFNPRYLTLMANKLCESLIEKVKKDSRSFPKGIYTENNIVERKLIIEPHWNRSLQIRMKKRYYYDLLVKLNEPDFDGKFVSEKHVASWLYRNVIGKITAE